MWFALAVVAVMAVGFLLIITVVQFETGSRVAGRWLVYTVCAVIAMVYLLANKPPGEKVEYSYMPLAVQAPDKPQIDGKDGAALPVKPKGLPVNNPATGSESSITRTEDSRVDGTEKSPPGSLAVPLPDSAPEETPLKLAVVVATSLNIRTGPDLSSQIRGTVKAGSRLIILEDPGNGIWVKIRNADSSLTGWVCRDYLQVLP